LYIYQGNRIEETIALINVQLNILA
jgi:hypothetical protein